MSKRERKRLRRRMLRTGERLYAWYSSKMDACLDFKGRSMGHCIYKRPDGKLVMCTLITDRHDHDCGWDDMKYLGKVIGPQFGGLVAINKPPPELIVYEPEPQWRPMATLLYHNIIKPPCVIPLSS